MTDKTVDEMLTLLAKTAEAGDEFQTAASGAAAIAAKNRDQAEQEAGGGADLAANTAQKTGDDVASIRENVKDKLMRAAGLDKKLKQEGDIEAQVNFVQDDDAARGAVIDAGGDPQVPPGATEKPVMKTAGSVLSALFDELKKESGDKSDEEVIKIAEDAVSYGRWMARGFMDELAALSGEADKSEEEK